MSEIIDRFALMNKEGKGFEIKKIGKMSKALGDPYRLQIMEAVNKQDDWLNCTVLIGMFNLAQSTVWHHIKLLVDADLLLSDKDGRNARYKVNRPVFSGYISYLNSFGSKPAS